MPTPDFRFFSPIALAAILISAPAGAQAPGGQPVLPWSVCERLAADPLTDLAGTTEELLRLAESTGATGVIGRDLRRPSSSLDQCEGPRPAALARLGAIRIRLVPPAVAVTSNSAYPEDRNNGGLWSGRGVSSRASAGLRLSAGPVEAGFVPELRWSQNRDYDRLVVNRPGFASEANPYYNDIDLPQRFGDAELVDFSPGQGYVRVSAWKLAAGVSTENVWLGPAQRNPILLSNTAEGFPHAFVETDAPLDVWLADLEVSVLLGSVRESAYFDSNSRNDDGRLAAWTVTLRPRGLHELELGVGRTFRWDPDYAPDGLLAQLGIGVADEPGLGMLSLFGRFLLPESGADVWFEWARTDGYASVVDDLVTEPEHSQAFVAGFQKVSSSWLPIRLTAELAHLQEKQHERAGRPLPIYYTHPAIRQGHTHRGQLLGAAVGPGADAQYVEVDWLFGQGLVGVFVERLRRNDASQFAVRERFDSYMHDTQLTGGIRGSAFLRRFLLAASASHSHRLLRDFIRTENNLRLTMEISWWP